MNDTVAPTPELEAAGTSRIDPDTRGVQWTVVGLVGLLGLTSFVVSFRALHDVAAWAGIGPGLQWAVPVFIDGAILTYALAVLVHRSRGESVWPSWTSLAVFTAMSVAANAAHAVAAPQEVWWQTWVGAALAALAPLGVFAATEQMARLVVLRPQDRKAIREAPEPVAEPAGGAAQLDVSGPSTDEPEAPAEEPAPEPEAPAEQPAKEAKAPAERVASTSASAAPVDAPAEESMSESASEPEAAPEPSEDEFVAWVQQRHREGEAITGPTAGAFLGVSERTGRNRIKELRAARPELFEEDAA